MKFYVLISLYRYYTIFLFLIWAMPLKDACVLYWVNISQFSFLLESSTLELNLNFISVLVCECNHIYFRKLCVENSQYLITILLSHILPMQSLDFWKDWYLCMGAIHTTAHHFFPNIPSISHCWYALSRYCKF